MSHQIFPSSEARLDMGHQTRKNATPASNCTTIWGEKYDMVRHKWNVLQQQGLVFGPQWAGKVKPTVKKECRTNPNPISGKVEILLRRQLMHLSWQANPSDWLISIPHLCQEKSAPDVKLKSCAQSQIRKILHFLFLGLLLKIPKSSGRLSQFIFINL